MRGDPPPGHQEGIAFAPSTPHARGSTRSNGRNSQGRCVYPACAGIHPRPHCLWCAPAGLPRMRGDPPGSTTCMSGRHSSTPHARGSTCLVCIHAQPQTVYPACAGIHPRPAPAAHTRLRLPRMRGDPPRAKKIIILLLESTPHARGSTSTSRPLGSGQKVYPACAGIHPDSSFGFDLCLCLPRMRGDPPSKSLKTPDIGPSTPHARGSTAEAETQAIQQYVYPACAGIHLAAVPKAAVAACLPRMRGDPPHPQWCRNRSFRSTPHARGSTCFAFFPTDSVRVYPACAGIHRYPYFLVVSYSCLPRMRGDPPPLHLPEEQAIGSTPHARGSTPYAKPGTGTGTVYPACAGIHPVPSSRQSVSSGLPRMRGDPPYAGEKPFEGPVSTPHARGSTFLKRRAEGLPAVYPACAGIHLTRILRFSPHSCLPRMRGDPPCPGVPGFPA